MKKKFLVGSMLAAFLLAAGTVRAQSVDQKIQSLEQELLQLKEQQIEFKKEATAQVGTMPTFEHRPGTGLTVNAADQSWGIRFGYEWATDIMKLQGNDARREGDLGIFLRRNRPQFSYYWDKGFYELLAELDMDGDETGGKATLIQRACMRIHFEQMNPYLPYLQFGVDCSGAGSRYRSSELTFELPSLDRNNGFNTGSHTGYGLGFELPTFGVIPGTHQLIYYIPIHGMGLSDGVRDESNKMDHVIYYNLNPFNQVKNKWISGVGFSMFAWFGNIDDRASTNGNSARTFQLRTQEGSRRLVYFTSPTADDGLHVYLSPSMQYKIGPYQINGLLGYERYSEDHGATTTTGAIKAKQFKLMNDLMVWSPKGLLTGAPNEAGTLGFGYSFEKTNVECNFTNCGGTGFKRNVETVYEWGLRYWIRTALSVHLAIKNYNFANSPTANQIATGCTKNVSVQIAGNPGKSCSFTDAVLRFAYNF